MQINPDAEALELVRKRVDRRLMIVTRDDHAGNEQLLFAERIDQPQDFAVVCDIQIVAHFVVLDVAGMDRDDDLRAVLELFQHPDLAVRRKARQHARRMVVVKQLAAEFQIQLVPERADPLQNLLRLQRDVPVVVKTDFHMSSSIVAFKRIPVCHAHFGGQDPKNTFVEPRFGNRSVRDGVV